MIYQHTEMLYQRTEMLYQPAEIIYHPLEMAPQPSVMIKQHCAVISVIDYLNKSYFHPNPDKIYSEIFMISHF